MITTTNTLLDLLASPAHCDFYETLHTEVASALNPSIQWADPTLLNRLPRLTSAIRESLRRNPILNSTPMRQVVCKSGLDLPTGEHLEKGAWIGIPLCAIMTDERFYEKANEYNPYRFLSKKADDEKARQGNGSEQVQSIPLIAVSDTYLSFGLGRNAW